MDAETTKETPVDARQPDRLLAMDAAYIVDQQIRDKNSALSKLLRYPALQEHREEILASHLETAELSAARTRLDAFLVELHILNQQGIESLAALEAYKIKDHRPEAWKGVVAISADLNGLKLINDQVGHEAGDDAIKGIAAIFRSVFRETDIIGHPHGDEFIILMPSKSADQAKKFLEIERKDEKTGEKTEGIFPQIRQHAETFRERIRNNANQRYQKPWPNDTAEKHPGTVSMGWHFLTAEEFVQRYNDFVTSPEKGKLFTNFLIREADQNMYEMKRKGANAQL